MTHVFLTGSHLRHAYMARSLAASGTLAALVIEEREDVLPEPPPALRSDTARLFRKHFADRFDAEKRFFGKEARLPDVPVLRVRCEDLNGLAVREFVNAFSPDTVFSYGVHKLEETTLRSFTAARKWNIHGGLSPWYRGVTTHFWPSYFLEPQMTGMTVHELSDAIDGGHIVHQSAASLVKGDGIHDLACRAVISLGEELPLLLNHVSKEELQQPVPQKTTGRVWRGSDWRPEHLHLIYDFHDNKIVDHYLDGAFEQRAPKLVRQF